MSGSGTDGARIAMFGDGKWAALTLQRLAASRHQVIATVLRRSPSDASFADAAAEEGVPVLQPERANDPAFVAAVRALAPDLIVSVAYDQILRGELRAVPRLGCLNVHAGALPKYRGRNVINWAIINGEREIGLTAHLIDEGIDTGDILLQQSLPIGWTDTYGDVLERVVEAIPSLIEQAVDQVADGSASPRRQDHSAATYCGGRVDGDEWIDWNATSRRVHNLIRGIASPGPGARTSLGGSQVTVWKGFYDPGWPEYLGTPGEVVGRNASGVVVKTGDSTLLVQEVQVPGGERLVPTWPIGTRLGYDTAASLRAVLRRLEALESHNGR